MTQPENRSRFGTPELLLGLGVLASLAVLAEFLVRLFVVSDSLGATTFGFQNAFVIGVVTSAPFIFGLGYAGYWLASQDIHRNRHPRVALWCFGGGALFLGINVAVMAAMPSEPLLVYLAWIRWALVLGAGTGVLIGIIEARAIENALEIERTNLHANYLETQRDLLDYLNSLLRHEVLNTVNVVEGYASLLESDLERGTNEHEYTTKIQRQSRELERVIDDVRVLLTATREGATFEPVDLNGILSDEAARIETSNDAAEVDLSVPEGTTVQADPLIRRVFGNLLSNAVEHNDSGVARISVSVETTDVSAIVTIADNGPDIPDDVAASLFSRPENAAVTHGLGLYLVDQLVEYYGGSIELADTSAEGSVFRVELPRSGRFRPETDEVESPDGETSGPFGVRSEPGRA